MLSSSFINQPLLFRLSFRIACFFVYASSLKFFLDNVHQDEANTLPDAHLLLIDAALYIITAGQN